MTDTYTVKNERVINDPFEVVWSRLVKGLSKSFYVINNIEKESRIINISFSIDKPEQYINCGMAHRRYQRGTEDERWVYLIARSSEYWIADTWQMGIHRPHQTHYIDRKTSLEGRVNVYVAPAIRGTEVAVNSRHIFTVRGSATTERENIYGKVIARGNSPLPPIQHSFNTNQANTMTSRGHSTSCYSNGKLETEILNIAQNKVLGT